MVFPSGISTQINPETGRWEEVEDSPWANWTVTRVGPRSVQYSASGRTTFVEFADGVYRDGTPPDEGDSPVDPSEATIVEHGIHGPDNWRILILFPTTPEAPEGMHMYAELIVAGDIFIWTNWIQEGDGPLRRVVYSASRLAGG